MLRFIYLLFLVLFLAVVNAQNPVVKDPEALDLETEFISAMQYVALEEYDDALVKLKGIKNKVKEDGIVDFEIAKIYLTKNELGEAERYAKKAIDKDDSKSIYKLFLLDILKEENKYEEAARLMESMLKTQNFERNNYFKTASMYQRARNTKKALAVLDLLEKKTGYNREVELQRVNILLRSKKYIEAIKTLDKLTNTLGKNVEVLSKKAMTYRLMNDSKMAIKVYENILKIDSQNPVALSYLHTVQKFTQKEEDYIKSLHPMLNNPKIPLDQKIKFLIPFVDKVSKGSKLTAELIEASNIILNQYPDDAKSNALCADVLYNSGEIEKSEAYYLTSLKNSKKNFEIWKQLMTIYSYLEKWNKLAELSEDAIDYYPNQVSGYYNSGKAYLHLGKTKKGLEYLDEAMMYTGSNSRFHNEIILLQAYGNIVADNLQKAQKLLNDLKSDFKEKHPYYWELTGDISLRNGSVEEAKKYWEKSFKLGNNTKRLVSKLKSN